MSESKFKRRILQAICTLMQGGMERERIAGYIRETYRLAADEVSELILAAQYRHHG